MSANGNGSGKAARKAPAPRKVATPWGPAELVEEVVVSQRAGDQRFASHVQLLAAANGDRLVRFAYSSGGTARRGPVTLRARELEKLRAGLVARPELGGLLGLGGDA